MAYLYHSVPKDLVGTVLYPLNELKSVHPRIYEKESSKYVGREQVTQQKIPGLNCLWNDVLHFSAVHPNEIKSALLEAGDTSPIQRTYYQIDPSLINPDQAIIYLYRSQKKTSEENWTAYRPHDLEKYTRIPQATKNYYREALQQKKRPLLYHGIPHILYKGTLDIRTLPIISI